MDNVIQLLNTPYGTAQPKVHVEEIALIYQYLIDKFGDTSTTAFKLHEVLISLVLPDENPVCEHRKVIYNSCKSKACSSWSNADRKMDSEATIHLAKM